MDSFTYRGRLRSLQDVCYTLVGHTALLLRDVITHTSPRSDLFSVDATARGAKLLQVGYTSLWWLLLRCSGHLFVTGGCCFVCSEPCLE